MGSDSDDESLPLSKVSRKSSASDSNQRSTRPRRTAAVIARTHMLERENKTDRKSTSRVEARRDSKTKPQKTTKSNSSKQVITTDHSSSSSSDDSDADNSKRKAKDEEEEEEEEDDDDEQVEDPNKLYCICRKPYNKEYK